MLVIVKNLNFEYVGKRVLYDVSFTLEKGQLTALVGPNGAGKTTLMRCIAALEMPYSGDIWVDEYNVLDAPREIHKRIGYLSDFFGLYEALSVKQCLILATKSHSIEKSALIDHVMETASILGLENKLNDKVGTLSRGWRQRLGIAEAIIHKPQLLILDEPASGLDPEARIMLANVLKTLQKNGMTMLISSHILSELEDYCSDMIILREGRIMKHRADNDTVPQSKLFELSTTPGSIQKAVAFLQTQQHVQIQDILDNKINFYLMGDEQAQHKLLKQCVNADIAITAFEEKRKSLQDIYMHVAEEQTK